MAQLGGWEEEREGRTQEATTRQQKGAPTEGGDQDVFMSIRGSDDEETSVQEAAEKRMEEQARPLLFPTALAIMEAEKDLWRRRAKLLDTCRLLLKGMSRQCEMLKNIDHRARACGSWVCSLLHWKISGTVHV